MVNNIVKKAAAERGQSGETQLVRGESMALRLWDSESPERDKPSGHHSRDYEVLGYAISGKAELHLGDDDVMLLEAGTSWVVPAHQDHHYKILESFTAVEAISL